MSVKDKIIKLYPRLRMFALKLTNDKDRAEDLIQETMLKAFSNLDKFNKGDDPTNWTHTLMRNSFVNGYRKDKIRRAVSFDTPLSEPMSSVNADSLILVNEINEVRDSMSENLSKTLSLTMAGFKYEEISEIMKVPMGTVKSRVHLARKEVSRKYGHSSS